MINCKHCGVELEPDMDVCPLCKQPVSPNKSTDKPGKKYEPQQKGTTDFETRVMSKNQRKSVWELVSIILVLLVLTTSVINLIISKDISWSEYPVAVCLIIFSYVSSFSFINKKREIQLVMAFVFASVFIFVLDYFTAGQNWAIHLGIPLLFFTNIISVGLFVVFRYSKQHGINLIAYTFLAASLLGICTEVIIDLYKHHEINLVWSLIIVASAIPVAIVLLFMHYRLKRGRDLSRTFHI